MDGELLSLFGVTMEQLIFVSGAVYLLTELIKTKLSSFVTIDGWRTDVLAIVIAGLVSWKFCPGEPEQIAVLVLASWLLPAGFHKVRKNGGSQ